MKIKKKKNITTVSHPNLDRRFSFFSRASGTLDARAGGRVGCRFGFEIAIRAAARTNDQPLEVSNMAVYLPQAVEAVSSSSTQLDWMERELEVQVSWIRVSVYTSFAPACQVLEKLLVRTRTGFEFLYDMYEHRSLELYT